MAKKHIIKIRLEINISQDHLGLARVYEELKSIEANPGELSDFDLKALKRRYLLSILHQYCAAVPAPTSSSLAGVLSHPNQLHVEAEPRNPLNTITNTPSPSFPLATIEHSVPVMPEVAPSTDLVVVKAFGVSMAESGFLFTTPA